MAAPADPVAPRSLTARQEEARWVRRPCIIINMPSSDETPGTPVPGDAPVSRVRHDASQPPVADVPPLPSDTEVGFSPKLGASAWEYDYLRIGGGIFAGVAILIIILFSFTDLSEGVLPMEDRYLEILLPETEAGVRPLALVEVARVLDENRISASGRVRNTSLEPIENLTAVIAARETTSRFPETVEVPVDPALLEPGEEGTFDVAVTLRQRPTDFSIRFKIENGPFVPHSEESGYLIDLGR